MVIGDWASEMDASARSLAEKVFIMPKFSTNDDFEDQISDDRPDDEGLAGERDLVMEQILENINSTPIGQVLKQVASLPDVRKEKVLEVRRQLTEGQYNLNDRLDAVVDKVIEDLIV